MSHLELAHAVFGRRYGTKSSEYQPRYRVQINQKGMMLLPWLVAVALLLRCKTQRGRG